jgi:hypothetical protein
VFIEDDNLVAEGLARLLTQYQSSTALRQLLSAFILQVQTIEDALTGMNTLRYLSDASGQQLDNIGEIVGIARAAGQSDASYLTAILGQININTSQGQPEQIIRAFILFTGVTQVRFFEFPPASYLVESTYDPSDLAAIQSIFGILNDVSPAGVKIDGIVVYDPVSPFCYAGSMLPAAGYGSTGAPGVGGKYGFLILPFNGYFGYAGGSPEIAGYGSRLDPTIGGIYAG